MPTRPTGLHVTPTTLTCTGLPDIAPELAAAIVDWLHAHDLDELQLIAGEPIIRDPAGRTLTYTIWDGAGLVTKVTVAPSTQDPATRAEWPAPFPQILLDQQPPEVCPACGHPLDPEDL